MDILRKFSTPPSTSVQSYKARRAGGNHWRTMSLSLLSDCDGSTYQAFDFGMASPFTRDVVNKKGDTVSKTKTYVGVLTKILKLDYGPLPHPVVIFKGKWMD